MQFRYEKAWQTSIEMKPTYNQIHEYRRNKRGKAKRIIDLIEVVLASTTFPISIWVTKNLFIQEMEVKTIEAIVFFAFILISWFVLSRITAMAKLPRTRRYRTLAFEYIRVTFIVLLALLAVKVIFRFTSLPVLLILVYVTALFILTFFFRFLAYKVLKTYRTYGRDGQNVLIIADAFSDGVIEKLQVQKEWGFKIVSIITDSKLINAKYGNSISIIPVGTSIKNVIDKMIIDEVIYCRRDVDIELIKKVIKICDEVGIIFRLQSSVSPLDPTEFQLKTLNKNRDLTIVDIPSNSLFFILKSMGDIYFSIMALILLFPFFLIIGTIIKIGSKGPVLFVQERIGLRGRKFKLYKFRTMIVDAEEKLKLFKSMNEADGPVFKLRNDPRITRFGRFLRKTGLDELPQLINVIKGEMSLIGPRPPLEEEIKQYERWQLQRLSVKPGITCSWQITPDRNEVSFEEWMHLDKMYIENWNLRKDVGLFFKTVRTFFLAGGR